MENLQPMGIGRLGEPSTFFVKKCRWTLKGDVLKEHCPKKVSFDFRNKTIDIEAYEVVVDGRINVQEWIDSNKTDVLVFETYDGCGVPIYSYEISDYNITFDTCSFDYESSESSVRSIRVSYKKLNRISHLASKQTEFKFEADKNKRTWRMHWPTDWEFGVIAPETVVLKKRPTLKVEEVEINFLNAKTWLPGKTKWENLEIEFNGRPAAMLSKLTMGLPSLFNLTLLDGTNQPLEQWSIRNSVLVNMNYKDEVTKVVLALNEVEHLPVSLNVNKESNEKR